VNECSADGRRTYSISGGGGGGLLEWFLATGPVSDDANTVIVIDEVVWDIPARDLKRARGDASRTSSAWSQLLSLSEVPSLPCCRWRVLLLGFELDGLALVPESHGSFRAMRGLSDR